MQEIYCNPIINSDYSDPDVIRVKNDFFMVASSFNHTPGVPVLHSRDLVNWKIINYVFDEIPFKRFNDVCHGDGAWAPAIRYHNNKYYAIIPFPDEGIYISSCDDPFGKWSDLWCLIPGKGIIDPCPIWVDDKCYLVVGFAKSRIGFNSCLGLYEVSSDLKEKLSDYQIIYDGHNDNPTIEGPKFNERNGYFYIMAPAGSVKSGWQVCLRSKSIYGPYETKIVLMQNGTAINGPHQGALIELKNDQWAFIHFQDKKCYGRVVHLQPVKWINDWPICGMVSDELLAGSPYSEALYPLPKAKGYKIPTTDKFKGQALSMIWQTPANKAGGWYKVDNGLNLYSYYHDEEASKALNKTPNLFLQKLIYPSFKISARAVLHLENNDETGLCLMGEEYAYICIKKENEKMYIQLCKGSFKEELDTILFKEPYEGNEIIFNLKYKEPNQYSLGINNKFYKQVFTALPGRWIGSKVGVYTRGKEGSKGYAFYSEFIHKGLK